ncbi:C-terminal binding protein [Gordonia terrae]
MTRVLITDYAWPSLDVERAILATAGVELVVAETGDTDELVALAADVDAILTCFATVSARVLDAAPHCRTVARYGVGVDNIDVAHATQLGILVSNVPEYCSEDVADHTLLLMLALSRRLKLLTELVSGGGWDATEGTGVRLRGRVIGLVGLGAIGRALVPRAQAVGLDVLAWHRSSALPPGVRAAGSLDDLLSTADIVSLHVPSTPETVGLIGAAELARMKSTAWLINTARGTLVDTDAVLAALQSGQIAGAGLDVTDPEPLPPDHPLRRRGDVVLTPHVAFSSVESLADLARKAATNVIDALAGHVPADVINPEVLAGPHSRLR